MATPTNEQIKEIAEQLDCGFKCFWHKQTDEFLFVPDTFKHPDMDNEFLADDFQKLDDNFGDYDEIEAMQSSDAFQIMSDFTEQLDDSNGLKHKLTTSLTNKKPFREFKFIIDNSGVHRQQWFDFKTDRLQQWVLAQVDGLLQNGRKNGSR